MRNPIQLLEPFHRWVDPSPKAGPVLVSIRQGPRLSSDDEGQAVALAEQWRHLGCALYTVCVDEAAEKEWGNFACTECPFRDAK